MLRDTSRSASARAFWTLSRQAIAFFISCGPLRSSFFCSLAPSLAPGGGSLPPGMFTGSVSSSCVGWPTPAVLASLIVLVSPLRSCSLMTFLPLAHISRSAVSVLFRSAITSASQRSASATH